MAKDAESKEILEALSKARQKLNSSVQAIESAAARGQVHDPDVLTYAAESLLLMAALLHVVAAKSS